MDANFSILSKYHPRILLPPTRPVLLYTIIKYGKQKTNKTHSHTGTAGSVVDQSVDLAAGPRGGLSGALQQAHQAKSVGWSFKPGANVPIVRQFCARFWQTEENYPPLGLRFPIGFWGSCWRWFFRVRAIRSNRPNKNRPRRHDCQGGCQMLASGTIQRLFSGPPRSMAGLARLFLSVERFEWRGGEAIPAVEWLEPNGLAARQSPTAWPNRGQPCLPHG